MSHMDGTGPHFAYRHNGRPFRKARTAVGCGFGHGFGRGLGFCRSADTNSKESLIATKAVLQRRLADVEKLLQEN